ncbi:MAG: rhomboid family intramembrane serine protease [Chloroflexi bacterium]|nr:MAG: rhomboid family intramembrane serine protease [Chloroflexota bacterium]PIE80386.1 MAG: rhomboid family intramembrane serine protease [Chloroflexota bacterium]
MEVKETAKTQAFIIGGFIVFLWLVEIVDTVIFQGGLAVNGIHPRTVDGLQGILFAPILHSNFSHLMANTIPLLVLGWFVLLHGFRTFSIVTIIVTIISGLGTWLIGPANSVHIGASGLIFGYFGYLLLNSWFERSPASILWAVLVLLLYGGLIWGVLPQGNGISWQGHLFGFIGGGMAAHLLAKRVMTV